MNPSSLPLRLAVFIVVFILSGPAGRGQIPHPAFPVGSLSAETYVTGSSNAVLTWSIILPDGENPANYTYFIRQVQFPYAVMWDDNVAQSGQIVSTFPIEPGGSSFQLWAVRNSPLTSYLLASTVCSNELPRAGVTIRTEDPYPYLPRTRADRPFLVEVSVHGLLSDAELPDSAKSVKLIRQAQSYGTNGTGLDLDRFQATLLSSANIAQNGDQTLSFTVNAVPGEDRAKVRGEERFSVFTQEDFMAPESQISSQTVQIWPVADGSITGISQGQNIGPVVPALTFTLHDLYPSSTTWAQVYQGTPRLGASGRTISGSTVVVNSAVPQNRVVTAGNDLAAFDSDGVWTMELLTKTPFGTDRLATLSFNVRGTATLLENWRLSHFGSTQDQGHGADLADYDKDGLANLVEFAFGLNPKQNSAGAMPTARKVGNEIAIRFTQPASVGGIVYGAEWSPDLRPGSWQAVEDRGVSSEHIFSVPMAGRPSVLMRLKVTGQ